MPRVTIVIPCYNQGVYVHAAVESVLAQTCRDFEIIIVNDGSTDPETNRILERFDRPRTRVIATANQGLSSARNNGIREAAGEFILPLDADDRIAPTYLEKGVRVLEERPDVGIVYSLAECFGDRRGLWAVPPYSLRGMLFTNLIFCSALFRKADWECSDGYNPNMRRGWEDWDFWLSLIEMGREVYRIPEVLFFYNVKDNSMVRSMDRSRRVEMHLQLMKNHPGLFIAHCRTLLDWYYRLNDSWFYRMLKRMRLTCLVGRLFAERP